MLDKESTPGITDIAEAPALGSAHSNQKEGEPVKAEPRPAASWHQGREQVKAAGSAQKVDNAQRDDRYNPHDDQHENDIVFHFKFLRETVSK